MSVIQGNAFSDDEVDTGDIGHALRFRGAQHLSRTFGTPTDNRRSTFSVWAKKAVNGSGTSQYLLSANNAPTYTNFGIYSSTDEMGFYNSVSSTNAGNRKTSEVHRDVTGWNHYLMVFDTPNATVEDRMQLWKNGVRITAFSANTAIAQNANPQINAATFHHIGAFAGGEFWNGYLSRICFVDGQALTPSSFGYLNTEINEWVTLSQSAVKAVVDAGGTNSFMLDFDNATSLTTLGYDKSSKGNNWTLNNFSLTAGTTYDHMLDVPGNSYATWSEINKYPSYVFSNAGISFSLTTSAAGVHMANGTIAASSGKWYWEVIPTDVGAGPNLHIGLRETVSRNTIGTNTGFPDGYAYSAGGVKLNNAGSTAYGAAYTNGDVVGVAFDADAGEVTFYKNGATQGVAYTGIPSLSYTPAVGQGNSAASRTTAGNICTGQAPLHASATYHSAAGGYFRYAPPTGFKALCQANLPDPAILNPKLHFDIKTRTGTAATYSVTGLGFQPDLLWSKSRGRAVDHALYDSVRGVQKQLESNQTGAETTETTGLTAFNSDGYTGGALDQINGTTATNSFVDWVWKAGGASVSNTAGSITSQVSANVDAGFSIVTYTGTGANATVGHGLGKALKMQVVKRTATTDGFGWSVWHTGLLATEALALNSTAAKDTSAAYWNSTAPTSSVISLGTLGSVNASTHSYVAYCFADIEGYSKAFSYTGNASTDGVYVDLGFKPRWILLKCSSTTGNWVVFDTTRNTYNVMGEQLYPNLANAGSTVTTLDITSRGFKARIATDPNSAQTFIGLAIADVAGKYSLGR